MRWFPCFRVKKKDSFLKQLACFKIVSDFNWGCVNTSKLVPRKPLPGSVISVQRRPRHPHADPEQVSPLWGRWPQHQAHISSGGRHQQRALQADPQGGLPCWQARHPQDQPWVLYAKSGTMSDRSWRRVKTFFGVGSPNSRDPTPKKVLYAKSLPMSDMSWQVVSRLSSGLNPWKAIDSTAAGQWA